MSTRGRNAAATARRGANDVQRSGRKAAGSKWMQMLARFGYAIKGVVYLIIGGLSVLVAIGGGGKTTDQKGALQAISNLPLGKFLLIIVVIGLIGFALWCFIQAIFDTEGKGRKASGIIARVGYAAVGVVYAALAFGALQLITGSGNGGKSSTTNTQDWTATLLQQPFGQVLVVIVGLVVLGIAGYLGYKAYSANFQKRLNLSSLSPRTKRILITIGRAGYAALCVVFIVIGIFLIVAAFQDNATKAKGLDGVLQVFVQQSFGPILLGLVALGLIAYGVFSFVEARYRRVGV